MFEVTVTINVDAENIEQAKDNAIEYFRQIEEIKDEEVREMK